MSRENVEIVRQVHERFLRGDYPSMFELIAEDVEWDDSEFPGGGRYRGHDGMTKAANRWFGAWDDYEVEFLRYFEAGDMVVSFYRQRGRGKGSDVPIQMDAGQVWTVRNGVVIKVEVFAQPADALQAAGLSD